MKIKKDFVNLIYNKEKQYEFRNSGDKVGIYKIKDKFFQLKQISYERDFKIKKEHRLTGGLDYYFCGFEITEQEYKWIKNNIDYFVTNNKKDTYIVIYKWEELEPKELEVIE